MARDAPALAAADGAPLAAPSVGSGRRIRLALADGALTTVYLASYDAAAIDVRVAVLGEQSPLEPWCARRGVTDAIVGGFFVRHGPAARRVPLGEVRTGGVLRRHVPFAEPFDAVRACVHVEAGAVRIASRAELPAQPRGDLLQAGPLLVAGGRAVFDRAADAEGFSAAAHQFDSDITDGRHPRAALAVAGDRLLAVACDGRGRRDAGLTLEELAALLVALGADAALNLDGGGSTSIVWGGRLRNQPRGGWESPEVGGRPISTALLLAPR